MIEEVSIHHIDNYHNSITILIWTFMKKISGRKKWRKWDVFISDSFWSEHWLFDEKKKLSYIKIATFHANFMLPFLILVCEDDSKQWKIQKFQNREEREKGIVSKPQSGVCISFLHSGRGSYILDVVCDYTKKGDGFTNRSGGCFEVPVGQGKTLLGAQGVKPPENCQNSFKTTLKEDHFQI